MHWHIVELTLYHVPNNTQGDMITRVAGYLHSILQTGASSAGQSPYGGPAAIEQRGLEYRRAGIDCFDVVFSHFQGERFGQGYHARFGDVVTDLLPTRTGIFNVFELKYRA